MGITLSKFSILGLQGILLDIWSKNTFTTPFIRHCKKNSERGDIPSQMKITNAVISSLYSTNQINSLKGLPGREGLPQFISRSRYVLFLIWKKVKYNITHILTLDTVNSEIFVRILFWQNFTVCKNKTVSNNSVVQYQRS